MKQSLSCVVCGNYGARNIGDEAIAEGIAHVLKTWGHSLCFLVANTEAFAQSHPQLPYEYQFPFGIRTMLQRFWSIPKTLKVIREADIFIVWWGGLFHRHESILPLILWGGHCVIAKLMNVPYVWYGMSLSDYSDASWWQRAFFWWCCKNAHGAFLRDETSLRIFETTVQQLWNETERTEWETAVELLSRKTNERKNTNTRLVGVVDDPAITWMKSCRTSDIKERETIIFGLAYEHTTPQISDWCAQKAQELKANGARVLCVGHTPADISFDWMRDFETVVPDTPEALQKLYQWAKMAFSMRLHSFLLAVFCDVPDIVVFPYHQKVIDQYNIYKRSGITLFDVYKETQEPKTE